MKKNNFFKIIVPLSFLVLLIFVSYDSDKYFSYNLVDSGGNDSTSVSGIVLRNDNSMPVANANVQFGYNRTATDEQGHFLLKLNYSQDDNRNNSLPVIIKAEKYRDYYGVALILPVNQEFEYKLTWRPPTIGRAVLLYNPNPDKYLEKILQAEVFDFDGFEDIDAVYGVFAFEGLKDIKGRIISPSGVYDIPLHFISRKDSLTAYFQSEKFDRKAVYRFPVTFFNYFVKAVDKQGFIRYID